jgi:hypothetical protein
MVHSFCLAGAFSISKSFERLLHDPVIDMGLLDSGSSKSAHLLLEIGSIEVINRVVVVD